MCHNIKIIAKIENGELAICENCEVYHLIFNNIFFQMSDEQLIQFKEYLFKIDTNYWENCQNCSSNKRKIPIPTLHENLILIFNRLEIAALKSLLSIKKMTYSKILHVSGIDYTLVLN